MRIPLVLAAALAASSVLGSPAANEDTRLDWWREARLGLFIHWGPVSLVGTEIGWSRGAPIPEEDYDRLYLRFDPTQFHARAWARLARDMGAGYLVLTSKHHDGFCLWDSAQTDYDIASTVFGRDVMRELADACRQERIVFCTYHSICDWRHPDYPRGSPGGKTQKPDPDMDRYTAYLRNQVTEIIRDYGPIGIMWFDGEWETPWTEDHGRALYDLCRDLQPSILVNNRVAKGREGMAGTTGTGRFAGDYDTPEQRVGHFQTDRPWESCITLCHQWAWKPDDPMKSLAELIRTLVTCAGGDGNLLLNVGPMPSGEIEPRQAQRLRELGRWLDRNGRSIYGTRGGPYKPGAWGVSTYRDRTLYLHVLDWPDHGRLILPPLEIPIRSATLLGGGRLDYAQSADGLEITKPAKLTDRIDTILALELAEGVAGLPPR